MLRVDPPIQRRRLLLRACQHLREHEAEVAGLVHVVGECRRLGAPIAGERERRRDDDIAGACPSPEQLCELARTPVDTVRHQHDRERSLARRHVHVGAQRPGGRVAGRVRRVIGRAAGINQRQRQLPGGNRGLRRSSRHCNAKDDGRDDEEHKRATHSRASGRSAHRPGTLPTQGIAVSPGRASPTRSGNDQGVGQDLRADLPDHL